MVLIFNNPHLIFQYGFNSFLIEYINQNIIILYQSNRWLIKSILTNINSNIYYIILYNMKFDINVIFGY